MSNYRHAPCPTCLCEPSAGEPPASEPKVSERPLRDSEPITPDRSYTAAVCDLPMSVLTRIDAKLRRCGLDPFVSSPLVAEVIDRYSRSYLDKREKSRLRSAAIRAAKKAPAPSI